MPLAEYHNCNHQSRIQRQSLQERARTVPTAASGFFNAQIPDMRSDAHTVILVCNLVELCLADTEMLWPLHLHRSVTMRLTILFIKIR